MSVIWLILFGYVFWGDVNLSKKNAEPAYVPWEIIVKYKDSNQTRWSRSTKSDDLSILSADLESNGLEIKENLDDSLNFALIQINDDKSVDQAIKLLEKNPNVEYAEPNYIRYLFGDWEASDILLWDPRLVEQRWLSHINWQDSYNQYAPMLKKSSVLVWIIDNGVNYNHPDLFSSMWRPENWKCKMLNSNNEVEEVDCVHWYDFVGWTSNPLQKNYNHGSHIAWIIGAAINNWEWVVWVNPYAKIAALKAWDDNSLSVAAELQAIDFAIKNNIKIINASYWSIMWSEPERLAIERFKNEVGWLFITSAWNDGEDIELYKDYGLSNYPCAYDLDNIICVASMDNEWKLSYFSNYWNVSVDIAAPGSQILSSSVGDLGNLDNDAIVYLNKFNDNSNSVWEGWTYYEYSDLNYGYKFSDELVSPHWIINLEWKSGISMNFKLMCDSPIDVDVQYKVWDEFNTIKKISGPSNLWQYTIKIDNQYYTNDFLFKIKLSNSDTFCMIDDLLVYEWDTSNMYVKLSWTSMATPHVVWLASLIWAMDPKLSYLEVKDFILRNGDDRPSLLWKIVTWKIINVKKTLDAVMEHIVPSPTNLISSWMWNIRWDPVDVEWDFWYYYEILDDNNEIVKSWNIDDISVDTELVWDYLWRVQRINKLDWNKSNFSTWYICKKPEIQDQQFVGFECVAFDWDFVGDKCSDMYDFIEVEDGDLSTESEILMDGTWTVVKKMYIQNKFWERTDGEVNLTYVWENVEPTLETNLYTYGSTITSTSKKSIWNVIEMFWAKDWECWSSKIVVDSVSCSEWTVSVESNILSVTAPDSKKGLSECRIIFKDDEWSIVEWIFKYSYDTVVVSSWWWSWGGWWGWGSGGWWNETTTYYCKNLPSYAVANNNKTPKSNTDYYYSTDTSKVCTFHCKSGYSRNEKVSKCEKIEDNVNKWDTKEEKVSKDEKKVKDEKSKDEDLEKQRMLDKNKSDKNHSSFDFSWYNNANPVSIMLNWYSVEFNNAYEFAHRVGITTIDSIEKANMNWSLTRIAMAKMLSNYAINILWKKPSNSVVPNFPDVSQKLNADYWWAVTLAYQLWIMGKWINKFRPYDTVTRAEFGTALSRMLYWIQDWAWKYYSTHLDRLYKDWIISNKNPELKESRWYVMIMLMRSVKNWNK